ncbi:uncharacterized protein LOC132752895 [Ruditapes philippinarum]|uniref:uncharacterized protein LOC132752895 n=1 Tax=Ruditapes philippinarum TaxID=129788 RepID=UPI00295A806F|nr:uncharacterized protein LOC132752895 [Ruditapes philippinarum]XP_060599282.1 uncharacterized protein LOC132752895 [Ruditapes philippinarum]
MEKHFKPKSKFRYLVQQVEEQSMLCDFTVNVGLWTKRFHRCVLVTSPYFDRAIRANFMEKQNGVVEVSVGTSNSVEMAIMYLYGVVPDINVDNVELLLQQAEYFMIAGLKTYCINWLCSSEITEETHMFVYQLSSVYNFEVPNCMAYIESHLPEVLQKQEALQFSKELIKRFFTDERLSYVTMDERLSFLIKWIRENSDEIKTNIIELFETIDIQDVTDSVLREASSVKLVNEILLSKDVVITPHGSECKRDVLIMSGEKGSLLGLDLQSDTWCKLIPENSYDILHRNISGIRNTTPEVYFTKSDIVYFNAECHLMPIFTTLNLETHNIHQYKFALKDEDICDKTITNVCLADNTLLVLTRKNVQIIETLADYIHIDAECPGPSSSNIGIESSRARIKIISDNEEPYSALFRSEDQNLTVKDTIYTTVYIGNVNIGDVEIVPILSLRNIEISQACLNSTCSTVALLSKENNSVLLFDFVNYKMETFCLEQDTGYTLSSTNNGFVIYNNDRCYCLTRTYWSLTSQSYQIKLLELESNGQMMDYLFCNGYWIRFYNSWYLFDQDISYIRHEELLASTFPKDLRWTKISIPEVKVMKNISSRNGLFVVQLAKEKLRCHIRCPHCQLSKIQN